MPSKMKKSPNASVVAPGQVAKRSKIDHFDDGSDSASPPPAPPASWSDLTQGLICSVAL